MKMPPELLLHALEHGAVFPAPEKPMTAEELDATAANLAKEAPERLRALAQSRVAADRQPLDWSSLDWTRAVATAAVNSFDWKNAEGGLALARAFADVEREYLFRFYTQEARDALYPLPPAHRAGACCARAFDALDAGDFPGCVHTLRQGLLLCPAMEPMIRLLLDEAERREQDRAFESAPPELRALADQVRLILARYAPDDPMVAELKASPAYQKVAYLLEK